ncbi:predicted protein [Fibroporia radiculosa]|uniref:Uncharacterized protein n=1 Tax=Fibroporia radiculosa TaxID=599839 RepID=J7SC99_9APHY|nr:predicted protein [Fibroporia radiculosa]
MTLQTTPTLIKLPKF